MFHGTERQGNGLFHRAKHRGSSGPPGAGAIDEGDHLPQPEAGGRPTSPHRGLRRLFHHGDHDKQVSDPATEAQGSPPGQPSPPASTSPSEGGSPAHRANALQRLWNVATGETDYRGAVHDHLTKRLPANGFVTITVESQQPLPPSCTSVLAMAVSVFTGLREATAQVQGGGWTLRMDLPDRLCDVILNFLDERGKTKLMAGFGLPSMSNTSEELVLPLMVPPTKGAVQREAAGSVRIRYSVAFKPYQEYQQLWSQQVDLSTYITPKVPVGDMASVGSSLASTMLAYVVKLKLVALVTALLDLLCWTSPLITLVLYIATIVGITIVGLLGIYLPALILGLICLLLFGRTYSEAWAQQAGDHYCDGKLSMFIVNDSEVAMLALSALWSVRWLLETVVDLMTWQNPKYSWAAVYALGVAAVSALILPAWIYLDAAVTAIFFLPGLMLKYPFFSTFVWPAYMHNVWRRRHPPEPFVGHLRVTVHRGHGMRIMDMSGNDPYVIGTVGTQEQHTSVRSNTCNPTWNEALDFLVFSPEEVVELLAWERDRTSRDDFIGAAQLHVYGQRGEVVRQKDVVVGIHMRPCAPDDFKLFTGGRLQVSWTLEDITPKSS